MPQCGVTGTNDPYSRGSCRFLVAQAWVPILAAALRRGVEDRPQRIEIGRAARILTGIGRARSHFNGPEVTDRAIAARKDVIGRHVSIFPADVIARVVPGKIRTDFVP